MDSKEKIQDLREKIQDNVFVDTFARLKRDSQKNMRKLVVREIAILLAAMYVGGIIGETTLVYSHDITHVYLDPASIAIGAFTTGSGFFFTLLIWVFFSIVFVQAKRIVKNEDGYDEERNYLTSNRKTYGSAHFLTDEESDELFNKSKNIEEFTKDILGMDKDGNMCSRKDLPNTNRNVAIVGASGSAKTVSIVIPDMLQAMRRGESIITTDTKGDLYAQTASLAKAAGYEVKVFDLKPQDMLHSDAVNFMKIINGDEVIADTVVDCIMLNTNDGRKQDFFYDAERNCLKMVVLYVDQSKDIPPEEKTLAKVYDIIGSNTVDGLDQLFAGIKPGHPAFQPYMSFKNAKNSREDALGGLGIRLQKLSSKVVKEIISHDEIDLRLPGTKKCVYYCVFSDQTKQFKFLSSLFFSELFIELIGEADEREDEKLPITVNFYIDEFKACGAIPEFDDKISTVRSRNITVKFIVQDLTQLERMYPDGGDVTILNNCTTQILLSSSDTDKTLKHFSALCGTQTIKVKNGGYNERKTDILHLHNEEAIKEGEGKRELMTIDELAHMNPQNMLVYIAGAPGVLKLKKMPYYKDYPGSTYRYKNEKDGTYYNGHPCLKYMKKTNIKRHIPGWYPEFAEKEQKDAEFENAASAKAPIEMKRRAYVS